MVVGACKILRLTKLLTPKNGIVNRCLIARSFYDGPHQGPHEPFHPIPGREPKLMSCGEAVSVIKSGDGVFIHGAGATPLPLIDAMVNHGVASDLKDVKLYHMHTEGPALYNNPEHSGRFRSTSLFTGGNCRKAIKEGRADYVPIFLSEIPLIFRRGLIDLNVALIQVTPPDKHGFCSLGTSIDCTRAAVQNADFIIAIANKNFPRTFGDSQIHKSHLDAIVFHDFDLPEMSPRPATPEEHAIGKLIAENLVVDGATLQMGIGAIPDAALALLGNHKDIGIHTEMFSNGVVDLVEKGVVTNALKLNHPGKIVSGFVVGSRKVYDFLHDNPYVVMKDIAYVNSTSIISQNPKVTAINSCIEIDLTGQVVSDSIGTRIFSGIGGQIDFLRGAALSSDGHGIPIVALQSTTKTGESKVVPFIKEGAGVVTTRAHVHYVVTEYGVAYLFGRNLRQRAHSLIQIAHPKHREQLEKAAFERLNCMPSAD